MPARRPLLIFGCLLPVLVSLANCNGGSGDRAASNSTDGGRRRSDERHGYAGGSGVANTCAGTTQGFSTSRNATAIYLDYKAMYTNCTYVLSNLEIVLPAGDRSNFDFSFLSGIREVKGYVLVYTTNMAVLPLSNLTIIRGEQLLPDKLANTYSSNFSLLIKFNANLRNLHLSSLKEISNGNVGLIMNEVLSCHTFSSVDWKYIFSLESQTIYSLPVNNQSLTCDATDVCHSSCVTRAAIATEEKHCWGPTADECQLVIRCSRDCESSIGGSGAAHNVRRRARCFGPEWNQCCHSECVGSCTGPYDRSCLACRNFKNENLCVPSCPDTMVYDPNTFKFVDNPNKRYAYGSFCVRRCPDNYAVFNKGCVISCPSGYTINASNGDSICEKCSGPCPKDCPVDFDADKDLFVSSDNIQNLANCTRITGNLVFPMDVFEPPTLFNRRRRSVSSRRALNLTDMAVLGTVKIVTGYVLIQSQVSWLTNLEFLGELEEIGGTKKYSGYSLVVAGQNITHLGLRSLQRIKDGGANVDIGNNCYTNQAALQSLVNFRSRSAVFVTGRPCNTSLCDGQCKDRQCWGPGPLMCLRCSGYAAAGDRTCVTNCSSRVGEYTLPNAQPGQGQKCGKCHEECLAESGCNGPTDGDCNACRSVRDGPYCRKSCPDLKYKDPSRSCQACHSYCRTGCNGSSSAVNETGCWNCHVALVSTLPRSSEYKVTQCLAPDTTACPPGHFESPTLRRPPPGHAGTSQFCIPCDKLCESCSFYGPSDCLTCKHVELAGNEDDDSRGNAVACAIKCPPMHYKELLPAQQPGTSHQRRVCRKCSDLCLDGCRGPSADECERCNGKQLYRNGTANFTCVEKCPDDAKYSRKGEHDQDVCSMTDPAVELREQAEKRNVPVIVGSVIGGFVLVLGAALAIACVCRQRAAAREKSRRYEAKMMGMAMSTESLNLTDAPPDLARLRLIKESEIRRGCVIGSGAFGTVYKGLWLPEGEGVTMPVAIKVLQEGTTPEQNKELLDEARIMATAMHPCCVRLIAVCLTSPMMLLTQLMPNGCLLEYVRKNKVNIGSKSLLDWSTQIAMGMEYLEGRGIVHRDLAARNVLVQNSGQVKITDFGLAKVLEYNADQYEATGGKMPIKWMALESIMDRIFTHKTDVWSYGVTLWELFTYGQRPYEGVRAYDMPQLLERGERLSQPTICTIDVYMILIKCWMLDADSRPPFADLVTDFGRMSKDPARYLVIAGDRLMKLNSVSYTARDLLDDDVDLAAAVAEQGSKVMDLDDYLQPATVASTTSDGSGTAALDRAVTERASGVKSLPAYPVGKVIGQVKGPEVTRSRPSIDSRYGPAPARLASSEEVEESAAEQQPFLPAVDEAGYLQPQPSTSIEDYLNPSTTRDHYLDVIPEDDLGFAKDKRNSSSPNDTPTVAVGKVSAAPSSRTPAGSPPSSSAAAAAHSGAPAGGTNVDNPEYYLSRRSTTLPSAAEPAADGLASTTPA